jgi:predicted nuclease with TOPRIM domain
MTTKEESLSASLIEKQSEVASLEDEVKKLTAERLNSRNFMDELKNKEANLKAKYEAVGLEYK